MGEIDMIHRKIYADSSHFVVFCYLFGFIQPILSFRVTSMALHQAFDYPSASEVV